ncbi:MAG: ABC transporter permease [Candidatus Goldiibacteriota bacterium]|jgi:peptide/nickel transport system permease protein
MKAYIFRRLLLMIPVLFGITIITFIIIHLTPGGFVKTNMEMNVKVSPDSMEHLKALYGLDKPIYEQYLSWLLRLIRLDFGDSFIDNRPVIDKVLERLPATLLLNITSLLVIFIFGIIIGVTSALKRNSAYDRVMTFITFTGYSVPAFWLALVMMMVFAVKIPVFPVSGMTSLNFDMMGPFEKFIDIVRHMLLPVFITAFGGLAYISRYVKSSMVEVLSQQYITAAYAKGMNENDIIYRSALKNSLMPVITLLGLSLPGLIGGSFIFETIFAWPGMGRLAYEAAMSFDYPVIMGDVTIAAVLTILGNFLADMAYAMIDPRIRYK